MSTFNSRWTKVAVIKHTKECELQLRMNHGRQKRPSTYFPRRYVPCASFYLDNPFCMPFVSRLSAWMRKTIVCVVLFLSNNYRNKTIKTIISLTFFKISWEGTKSRLCYEYKRRIILIIIHQSFPVLCSNDVNLFGHKYSQLEFVHNGIVRLFGSITKKLRKIWIC